MKQTRITPSILCCEGADGSGKSTLIKHLTKALSNYPHLCVYNLREPGGSPEGEYLRATLKQETTTKHHWSPLQQLLLMMASRETLYQRTIPETANTIIEETGLKPIFILDRNFLSSLMYQVYLQDVDIELYQSLLDKVTKDFTIDLTVICSPKQLTNTESQLARRGGQLDTLDKLAISNYEKLVGGYRNITEGQARSPILHIENDVENWETIGAKADEAGYTHNIINQLL